MTYYCKNCKCIIGKWEHKFNNYATYLYCIINFFEMYDNIMFLDCNSCNKFVGLKFYKVCENCFGKYIITEEEKLKKLFPKYKKTIKNQKFNDKFSCLICEKTKYREQNWFFNDLSFFI